MPATKRKAGEFLKAWEQFGSAYPSYKAFGDAHGYSYSWIRKLRQDWPKFLQGMEDIRNRHLVALPAAVDPNAAPEAWAARYGHLKPAWKGQFLETYRVKRDRGEAWDQVGKTFDEVEAALAADPAFLEAYESVEREIQARMQDAMVRGGLQGKTQAQNLYLTKHAGGTSGKLGRGAASAAPVDGRQRARTTWGEIYGRHYPAPASDAPAQA